MNNGSGYKRGVAGFSLVELMVTMGLSSIVLLTMLKLMTDSHKGLAETNAQTAVNYLRAYILQELTRPQSWKNTYTQNSSVFSTIVASSNCTSPGVTSAIDLYDSGATIWPKAVSGVVAGTSGNSTGFTTKIVRCNSAPSQACPIRVDITWVCSTNGNDKFPTGPMAYGFQTYFAAYFPSGGSFTHTGGFNAGYFGSTSVRGTVTVSITVHSSQNAFLNENYQSVGNGSAKFSFNVERRVP